MIYFFSLSVMGFVCHHGLKIPVMVNLGVNVTDKNCEAIFLADSSCRVSLLGRSCFYALDTSVNLFENIINKIVTFPFQAAFNKVKDKERTCIM